MENTILIHGKHISIAYNGRQILQNITIHVAKEEIVTIIGPNGSGKTSLVRILLGLIKPNQGTIHKHPGLNIGYMPQKMDIGPLMPLTVRRFLSLQTPKNKVDRTASEVGITHLLSQQMYEVSGGEMQRILLTRCLLRQPELLVLDEPIQGIDIAGQNEFYSLLDYIRSEHKTAILMVSHDLHMVMKSTDRVICINHHICCEGHPEDVSLHPEYTALFGADNMQSLAVYTHHHDHDHDISGEVIDEHNASDISDTKEQP